MEPVEGAKDELAGEPTVAAESEVRLSCLFEMFIANLYTDHC